MRTLADAARALHEMRWELPEEVVGGRKRTKGGKAAKSEVWDDATKAWKGGGAQVCAVFAMKGGVGKTTMVASMGFDLARRGKRVVLVDADPQCNLSEWLMETFEKFFESPFFPDNNAATFVRKVQSGQIGSVEPLTALVVKEFENGGQVLLVPGSPDFNSLEMPISTSCAILNMQPAVANIPGAFPFSLRITGWFYGADYVLVDLNPGGGAVNMLTVMTSDSFLIPANPSAFSVHSLVRGGVLFKEWKDRYDAILWNMRSPPVIFTLPQKRPRFAGVVLNSSKTHGGKIVKAFGYYVDEIRKALGSKNAQISGPAALSAATTVQTEMGTTVAEAAETDPQPIYTDGFLKFLVDSKFGVRDGLENFPSVPDMDSLAPLAHIHHVPGPWIPKNLLRKLGATGKKLSNYDALKNKQRAVAAAIAKVTEYAFELQEATTTSSTSDAVEEVDEADDDRDVEAAASTEAAREDAAHADEG